MATRKSQVQEKRTRSKTPEQKRARNPAKTEREKRKGDAERAELQRVARELLGAYPNHLLTVRDIAKRFTVPPNVRALSVALSRDPLIERVRDKYGWGYALRNEAAEGPPTEVAPVSPTLPSPRPVTVLPPPGGGARPRRAAGDVRCASGAHPAHSR